MYFVISDCFIVKFYIVSPANWFIPTLETTHFFFRWNFKWEKHSYLWDFLDKYSLIFSQCVKEGSSKYPFSSLLQHGTWYFFDPFLIWLPFWGFVCNITTYPQKQIPVTNWPSSHCEGDFSGKSNLINLRADIHKNCLRNANTHSTTKDQKVDGGLWDLQIISTPIYLY